MPVTKNTYHQKHDDFASNVLEIMWKEEEEIEETIQSIS
jgi:hypothetical protein